MVCHCDKRHGEVVFKEKGVIVEYVDPFTGCKSMADLQNRSLDVIYTINCPVYYQLLKEFDKARYPKSYREWIEEYEEAKKEGGGDKDDIFSALFDVGFQKLKEDGKLVIPFFPHTGHTPANLVAFVRERFPQAEFTVSESKTVPFPYVIEWSKEFMQEEWRGPEDYTFNSPNTRFLIFQKIDSRQKFFDDLHAHGKDGFLKQFLSAGEVKSRRLSEIQMNLLVAKITRKYPKVERRDIIALFRLQ